MDPVEYLSQARFHRSLPYGESKERISFAFVGVWPDVVNLCECTGAALQEELGRWQRERKKPVVLYVLPSGCSRYMGILLNAVAQDKDVSMLAIDRPGTGATPCCEVHERIDLATKQTIYVLQQLGVHKVDIFTHSVGWLYALELICRAPGLLKREQAAPRIIFSSPFVPSTESGSALAWLPESVVLLTPRAFSALSSLDKAFMWSAGFIPPLWSAASSSAEQDEKDAIQREKNRRRKPDASFHPPYRPHATKGSGLEAWKTAGTAKPCHPRTGKKLTSGEKLLFEYFVEEGGVKAATQDFLLCLGKAKGMDSKRMTAWIRYKMSSACAALTKNDQKAEFVLLWSENDGLIPAQGRRYLDEEFKKVANDNTAIVLDRWLMADAGHDASLASSEVLDAVFDRFNRS